MSLDMPVRLNERYASKIFGDVFRVTTLTLDTAKAHSEGVTDCEVNAVQEDTEEQEHPVRWFGSETEFRKQFDPIDPVPLPESEYTFSELDSYSLKDLQGIRKKLRDELTTEIHKRDALKAEILFLCTEIDKYKKGD